MRRDEVEDERGTVRVRVSSGQTRLPSVVVAAISGLLLVAVVKPWSIGGTGPDGSTVQGLLPTASAAALQAEPSPPATAGVPDPNAMACLSDETDQLVAIERWAGHEVRDWVAVTDAIGSGPLSHLATISIFSNHVIGLGVCGRVLPASPSSSAGGGTGSRVAPGAELLDVRLIVETSAGLATIDLSLPNPITIQSTGADAAVLFGAPGVTRPAGSSGQSHPDFPGGIRSRPAAPLLTSNPASSPTADWPAWPLGSYAIAFRFDSDGPTVVRWLRLNLSQGAGGEIQGGAR